MDYLDFFFKSLFNLLITPYQMMQLAESANDETFLRVSVHLHRDYLIKLSSSIMIISFVLNKFRIYGFTG